LKNNLCQHCWLDWNLQFKETTERRSFEGTRSTRYHFKPVTNPASSLSCPKNVSDSRRSGHCRNARAMLAATPLVQTSRSTPIGVRNYLKVAAMVKISNRNTCASTCQNPKARIGASQARPRMPTLAQTKVFRD
jgi:hypothetical protein